MGLSFFMMICKKYIYSYHFPVALVYMMWQKLWNGFVCSETYENQYESYDYAWLYKTNDISAHNSP